MSIRRQPIALGVIGVLLLMLGGIIIHAQVSTVQNAEGRPPAAKIEPRILSATANGQSTSFLILLNDQADLRAAFSLQDQDARGWYVYRTLTEHAARTQAGIRQFLDAAGVKYQSFWVANAILCEGGRDLVNALAARADVRAIEANHPSQWIEKPLNAAPANESPEGIEWNVQNVRAPQVWALGYTGQGIVIGNADTGMQWDHPALQPHYRGWDGTKANHNYNWHDAIHDSTGNPCGNDSQFPCDDYGHGTHTTGTTSGDDGNGNQIGVAPGAKWIGCRNMDQGTGTPARYTECFQFFIAPTDLSGNNPDPTLRPHVINNSWTCPPSEGCGPQTLQTIVENTEAAGIFVEASAGNAGPSCSTVTDPPAIYAATFSTGAYDSGNNLADFSSRGPVTSDGSGRMKPDISAPGVSVRSSYPTNNYAILSGTSMAGPHVVGTVALLWSANPALVRQIDQTKSTLTGSANPNVHLSLQTCGGIPSTQIPNNSFGWGAVDAYAAAQGSDFSLTVTPSSQSVSQGGSTTYTATVAPLGGFTGSVTLSVSGLPSGATGSFSPNPITGGAGSSTLTVTVGGSTTPGTYTLTVTGASGSLSHSASVSLVVTAGPGGVLSPASLNFGNQVIHTTSAARKVTLTNNGGASLVISSVTITGTNAGDFAQTNNCPGTLNVGKSCVFSLTFAPSIVGGESATLNVIDNASNSPQTAALSGTGIVAATLAPASGNFGNVAEGTPSAPRNFTLTNNQSVALNISSITTSNPDYAQTNTCGGSVAAHGHCTISVTFTPSILGTETGTLMVNDSASNSPQTASMTGTGVVPATLMPTSANFGNVPQGTPSSAKNFTLTNNAVVALSISSITASNPDYTQTNTCGSSVAAHGHCTISVTFTPSNIGTETGTLTVTDGALNSPQTASLTGVGIAQATVMPTTITFAAQKVGTTSGAHNVTLKNNLSTALSFSVTFSGADPGDFASPSNSCGGSVPAKSTCTIGVTFTPTATGTRTATLDVNDSANNSPQTVSLTGTGK